LPKAGTTVPTEAKLHRRTPNSSMLRHGGQR
jgi:hypothetical protein